MHRFCSFVVVVVVLAFESRADPWPDIGAIPGIDCDAYSIDLCLCCGVDYLLAVVLIGLSSEGRDILTRARPKEAGGPRTRLRQRLFWYCSSSIGDLEVVVVSAFVYQ